MVLVTLLSLSFVSAGFLGFGEENEEANFELTAPEGYVIDHTVDGKVYIKEEATNDLITVFEVNGETGVEGYENQRGTYNPQTLESENYTAYKTHDQQKTGNAGSTVLRTEVDGHDFQLVWEHDETVNFDEQMFEDNIEVLNEIAQSIKMK